MVGQGVIPRPRARPRQGFIDVEIHSPSCSAQTVIYNFPDYFEVISVDIRAFGENRPDFCDFVQIFVVKCMFRTLLSCLPNGKITPGTCPKSQKSRQHHKILVLHGFLLKIRPDSTRTFTKMRPYEESVSVTLF